MTKSQTLWSINVPSRTAASETRGVFHQATILPCHAVNQDFSASLTALRQEVGALRKMASRSKWQSQRCIVDTGMSNTMCQVTLYVTSHYIYYEWNRVYSKWSKNVRPHKWSFRAYMGPYTVNIIHMTLSVNGYIVCSPLVVLYPKNHLLKGLCRESKPPTFTTNWTSWS